MSDNLEHDSSDCPILTPSVYTTITSLNKSHIRQCTEPILHNETQNANQGRAYSGTIASSQSYTGPFEDNRFTTCWVRPSTAFAFNFTYLIFIKIIHFKKWLTNFMCDDGRRVGSIRDSQRQFLSRQLVTLRKMSPRIYKDSFLGPALQYFLATLCDLQVQPDQKQRLGARYMGAPDVKKLLSRLDDEKFVSVQTFAPNAMLAALKQILATFPGGIFVEVSEEFYQISLDSPLSITIVYLHGLLGTLPYFLRQFVYLICLSLRNLVNQSSGTRLDSYTDLLITVTPVLFPSCIGDLDIFLRAARLTLVMVDCCELVFAPLVWLDHNGNAFRPLPEDEAFFYQILASLGRLEETLNDDSGNESDECDREVQDITSHDRKVDHNHNFYQFTYDLEGNNSK